MLNSHPPTLEYSDEGEANFLVLSQCFGLDDARSHQDLHLDDKLRNPFTEARMVDGYLDVKVHQHPFLEHLFVWDRVIEDFDAFRVSREYRDHYHNAAAHMVCATLEERLLDANPVPGRDLCTDVLQPYRVHVEFRPVRVAWYYFASMGVRFEPK